MDDNYTFAMNILFIIPSVKTGGGNRVFIELASRLSRDHEITMLYPAVMRIGRPSIAILCSLCLPDG